jgi:hypothetical protein
MSHVCFSHARASQVGTGAVGDEHHFIFACPALAPVRDRLLPLFASGLRSLRLFIWQQDLHEVVRFVHECLCFALASWALRVSSSHQPLVAEQM